MIKERKLNGFKSLLIKALLLCAFSLQTTVLCAQENDIRTLLEMSLEDLMKLEVTIASKTSESITEAPGIVSVISRKEIESFAESNLGDILNRVVSTSFLSANILTKNSVAFRGQSFTPYNNHTLFLMNGRPIRDPISGGLNAALLTTFPVNAIDRIEIIRGPGSVLYGSCAYSGVVNLITREFGDDNSVVGGEVKAGSFGTREANAHAFVKKDDFNVTVGFKNYFTDGPEFEFIDYLGVDNEQKFWEKGSGVFANAKYKDFSFNFGLLDYKPYSLGGVDNSWSDDWGDKEQHTSYFTDFGFVQSFGDRATLNVNLTSNRHTWHTDYGKVMEASDIMGEVNFLWTPLANLNIVVGGIYGQQEHLSDYFFDGSQSYVAFYMQGDYYLNPTLKAIVGLQYNNVWLKSKDLLDAPVKSNTYNYSPRVGLIQNITGEAGVKLLYGQAFRKPYPLETSFNIPQLLGNHELDPELITTWEGQLFYNHSKYQLALTGYYSQMKDMIFRTPYSEVGVQYVNGLKHQFWGIEYESKLRLGQNFLVLLSGNYQENKDEDNLSNAALHPNLMVKGGVIYSRKALDIGVYNSYFGKPHPVSIVNPEVNAWNPDAEAHSLLSFKVAYDLATLIHKDYQLKIAVSGQNILNSDVQYPEFTTKGVNTLLPLRSGAYYEVSMSVHL
ncbi:MAG: TonB-dependent receptor [Marinilabiliaceae bacterium]|nr:TonB-dependent receptor [Marinilabiliaceae bacterium]